MSISSHPCHWNSFVADIRAFRCMAHNKDPDKDALYCCEEHTNLLVEDVEWGVLWNEYGIVEDLMVRLSFDMTTRMLRQTYT